LVQPAAEKFKATHVVIFDEVNWNDRIYAVCRASHIGIAPGCTKREVPVSPPSSIELKRHSMQWLVR
jgi:hypothetical protein